tara:strand:- start:47 stop:490 length:444 start_codon:yes stop_codon:yes gene_type:complete
MEEPVEIPSLAVFEFDFKELPTKQDISLNITAKITVGASDDQQVLENGKAALSGRSSVEIEQIARDMVFQEFASAIEIITIEDINRNKTWFLNHCSDIIDDRLSMIGLHVLDIDIIDITDNNGWIERAGARAREEMLAKQIKNQERE